MSPPGRLFVPPGSRIKAFAEAVSWLWRLGPVGSEPSPGAVGMGWLEDEGELSARVRERQLAGAVIFATRPGPDVGVVPGREPMLGIADFGRRARVRGQFTVLHGGREFVRSSLGVHATREDRIMVAGLDPDAAWGTLTGFWLYPALAEFLASVLEEPLLMMPPVGWFRYDDAPGNLSHQIVGTQHSDSFWRRRMRRLRRSFEGAGAVANLAIAPLALKGEELVTVEQVWPDASAEIRAGVDAGTFEIVAHGLSHTQPEALHRGELEPREFLAMDAETAGERVDRGIGLLTDLGGAPPRSFVAPNWRYGEGLITALSERGIPAWLPVEPGPLREGQFARETLVSTLNGLHRLDYEPLGRLAHAGIPPTLVIHGGLFDSRMKHLGWNQNPGALARLAWRRDIFRVPWAEGVRWIAASDLLARIDAHDRSSVEGGVARLPDGAEAVLYDGHERRAIRG